MSPDFEHQTNSQYGNIVSAETPSPPAPRVASPLARFIVKLMPIIPFLLVYAILNSIFRPDYTSYEEWHLSFFVLITAFYAFTSKRMLSEFPVLSIISMPSRTVEELLSPSANSLVLPKSVKIIDGFIGLLCIVAIIQAIAMILGFDVRYRGFVTVLHTALIVGMTTVGMMLYFGIKQKLTLGDSLLFKTALHHTALMLVVGSVMWGIFFVTTILKSVS